MNFKKPITRSLLLAGIVGVIFVFGETVLRMFLSPNSIQGDLPLYVYNHSMSFWSLMGYSSIWMFLIAAVFSIVLGALNTKKESNIWIKMSYRFQVLFGWVFIILLEFVSGYFINIVLGLAVWNYSMFALNLMGQIAVVPSIMWLVLTPMIYFVDDLLRYYIWQEPHPDKFITYYTDVIK